jgi:hypothetical protein
MRAHDVIDRLVESPRPQYVKVRTLWTSEDDNASDGLSTEELQRRIADPDLITFGKVIPKEDVTSGQVEEINDADPSEADIIIKFDGEDVARSMYAHTKPDLFGYPLAPLPDLYFEDI